MSIRQVACVGRVKVHDCVMKARLQSSASKLCLYSVELRWQGGNSPYPVVGVFNAVLLREAAGHAPGGRNFCLNFTRNYFFIEFLGFICKSKKTVLKFTGVAMVQW